MQVFATSPAAVYTGIGNAFTRISSTEGMRALWRGVSSVILGAGPAHAVHFGTYEAVKELAGGHAAGSQPVITGVCHTFSSTFHFAMVVRWSGLGVHHHLQHWRARLQRLPATLL